MPDFTEIVARRSDVGGEEISELEVGMEQGMRGRVRGRGGRFNTNVPLHLDVGITTDFADENGWGGENSSAREQGSNPVDWSRDPGKTSYMTTTVSTKGQVVIPQSVRHKLGIRPGDRLSTRIVDGSLVLRPVGRPRGRARIIISPISGLPAIEPPEGAPQLTTEQVRALLADFP